MNLIKKIIKEGMLGLSLLAAPLSCGNEQADFTEKKETVQSALYGTESNCDAENNLTAHWDFNEPSGNIAYDSGSNSQILFHGPSRSPGLFGVLHYGTARIDGSLDFDGIDDIVNVTGQIPALYLTDALTIEAKIKREGTGDTDGRILWKKNEILGDGYALSINQDNHLWIHLFGDEKFSSNATIPMEEWTEVIGTYDRNQGVARLYINGTLDSEHHTSTPLTINYDNLAMGAEVDGRYSYPLSNHFEGKIDDLKLYSCALSPSSIDVNFLFTFYRDQDRDGFGNPRNAVLARAPPRGYVESARDCKDNDPNINPNAVELCDGLDNNCNGTLDEEFPLRTFYKDQDNDGFGNLRRNVLACVAPRGYVESREDCKDNDPNINPNATELCDGLDNNCNGILDDGFPVRHYFLDRDQDGFGNLRLNVLACVAPRRYVESREDCKDNDPNINPNATELCDGLDNNCNGILDEGFPLRTFYKDPDNDGFGSLRQNVQACVAPRRYVEVAGDCNGHNPNINPNAIELCDGLDNNCNGILDEGFPLRTFYKDPDNDGFGNLRQNVQACVAPRRYVEVAGDCNGSNPNINPNATELCDGLDNNCNGIIDEGTCIRPLEAECGFETLVAHWNFNEPSGDIAYDSGVNSHIPFHGPSRSPGLFGVLHGPTRIEGALYFDGVEDIVSVSGFPVLQLTEAFTISATIKREGSWNKDGRILCTKPEDGSGSGYALSINQDHHLWIHLFEDEKFPSNATIPMNEWTHVAGTYNQNLGVARLYINGSLDSEHYTSTPLVIPIDFNLYIGNQTGEYATQRNNFQGKIDDLKLYSCALPPQQINSER